MLFNTNYGDVFANKSGYILGKSKLVHNLVGQKLCTVRIPPLGFCFDADWLKSEPKL